MKFLRVGEPGHEINVASHDGVEVDDTRPIATSFPEFEALLDGLAQ